LELEPIGRVGERTEHLVALG